MNWFNQGEQRGRGEMIYLENEGDFRVCGRGIEIRKNEKKKKWQVLIVLMQLGFFFHPLDLFLHRRLILDLYDCMV